MRPLNSEFKAALIFYLVFAGLLILVSRYDFASLTATGVEPSPQIKAADLEAIQSKLAESWRLQLQKNGYQPQDLRMTEVTKLQEQSYNQTVVSWVSAENSIILPEANSEAKLVDLGIAWKESTLALGLKLTKTSWGYSKNRLWVTLACGAELNLAGSIVKIPLQTVMITQPLQNPKSGHWDWRGLLPVDPPELPSKTNHTSAVVVPLIKRSKPILPQIKKKAKVALIIDDIGFVIRPADEMLQIPAQLTWAILPGAPYTRKYALAAKERGFEIILHLPLEPDRPGIDPGPGLIKANWSEAEIMEQLNLDLNEVPEAVGVNNHMGSAGTIDDHLMDILMREFKKRKLFFVDSMTMRYPSQSLTAKYAGIYQVPFARRQVFIDNSPVLAEKKAALRYLIKIALKDGVAIGIAHSREGTSQAILEVLPEFIAAGIEIVPVSELVH